MGKQNLSLLDGGLMDDIPEEKDIEFEAPERPYDALMNGDGQNALIEGALTLMNKADQTASAIKAKRVGLLIMQLGLAEVHALRLARVATTTLVLEERLYNTESIKELRKPSQIAEHLAVLSGIAKDSSKNIQGILGRASQFDAVEVFLKELADATTPDESSMPDRELAKVATDLLTKLTGGQSIESLLEMEETPDDVIDGEVVIEGQLPDL